MTLILSVFIPLGYLLIAAILLGTFRRYKWFYPVEDIAAALWVIYPLGCALVILTGKLIESLFRPLGKLAKWIERRPRRSRKVKVPEARVIK